MPALIPRSYLFVPGYPPHRFAKALASGADVVLLDLEDGVADDDKDNARQAIATWLAPEHPVYLRVNNVRSAWFAQDATLLRLPGVAGVILPKVDQPEDITTVRAYMHDTTLLVPLIETAKGLMQVQKIAAMPGVTRLAFGNWDLQLDTGISDEDEALLFARSLLVFASRAAGIQPPIEGVSTELDDMTPVAASVARARRLGFRAKFCIHPRQVPVVNAGFAPTPAELAWAQRVMDAVAANPTGAIRVHGEMIDKPFIERARAILASSTTP